MINVCISDVIAKDLIREINRIGVNIKQISRRLREMKIEDEITFSFTKLDELKVYLEKKIGLISNLQSQKMKRVRSKNREHIEVPILKTEQGKQEETEESVEMPAEETPPIMTFTIPTITSTIPKSHNALTL